jgi:hypothetical protein
MRRPNTCHPRSRQDRKEGRRGSIEEAPAYPRSRHLQQRDESRTSVRGQRNRMLETLVEGQPYQTDPFSQAPSRAKQTPSNTLYNRPPTSTALRLAKRTTSLAALPFPAPRTGRVPLESTTRSVFSDSNASTQARPPRVRPSPVFAGKNTERERAYPLDPPASGLHVDLDPPKRPPSSAPRQRRSHSANPAQRVASFRHPTPSKGKAWLRQGVAPTLHS